MPEPLAILGDWSMLAGNMAGDGLGEAGEAATAVAARLGVVVPMRVCPGMAPGGAVTCICDPLGSMTRKVPPGATPAGTLT